MTAVRAEGQAIHQLGLNCTQAEILLDFHQEKNMKSATNRPRSILATKREKLPTVGSCNHQDRPKDNLDSEGPSYFVSTSSYPGRYQWHSSCPTPQITEQGFSEVAPQEETDDETDNLSEGSKVSTSQYLEQILDAESANESEDISQMLTRLETNPQTSTLPGEQLGTEHVLRHLILQQYS